MTLARAAGAKELELRALTGEGWARLQEGELKEAAALLAEARALSEEARFSDIERADVLFRLGACRYQLSSISTAIGLFDAALELAERSQLSPTTFCGRRSSGGARAATAASATGRQHGKTSSVRSSWPRA